MFRGNFSLVLVQDGVPHELGIIIKSQELVMLLSQIHDHAILREYAIMQYNTAIRKRDKAWINHV